MEKMQMLAMIQAYTGIGIGLIIKNAIDEIRSRDTM